MEKINLIKPTKEYEQQAKAFIQEFRNNNSEANGTGGLDSYTDNYDGWLKIVEDFSKGHNLKEGYVPSSTYFAVRESDNRIIGMINIRHQLSDYLLKYVGHIGYSVRPTERQKGYATEILFLGLEKCSELGIVRALVTCDKSNIGSAKTIQNNFGVLENEIQDNGLEEVIQRYWIDVNYTMKNKIQNNNNVLK